MMKRIFTYSLFVAVMLCAFTKASAQTFKAIYCSSNTTLYFVYDNETYTQSGTFTPEESGSTALTISRLYTSPRETQDGQWGAIRSNITTVNFQSTFANYHPTSLKYWFLGCMNLAEVKNISNLNTSSVTNMSLMFYECEKLTSLDLKSYFLFLFRKRLSTIQE